MVGNTTDFGVLGSSTSSLNVTAQTPADASALVVNNTGNIRVDTTARALSELWTNQPLNTLYFQFADQATTDWINLNETSQAHTNNLLYATTRNVEIRVQVPQNEPPGTKSSTVQVAAEAAE